MKESVTNYKATPEQLKQARQEVERKEKEGISKKLLDKTMARLKKGDPNKDKIKRIV